MPRIQTKTTGIVVFDKPDSPLRQFLIAAPLLLLCLTGCDQIQQKMGVEDPSIKAARAEAEGKAVGGGCRHSGRAIEDCYAIYYWLPKDAIFSGWRDMDAYMRENKIETIEPQLPPPQAPGSKRKTAPAAEPTTDGRAAKPSDKASSSN